MTFSCVSFRLKEAEQKSRSICLLVVVVVVVAADVTALGPAFFLFPFYVFAYQ